MTFKIQPQRGLIFCQHNGAQKQRKIKLSLRGKVFVAQILVAENTVLFRVRSIYFALHWDFQSNQLELCAWTRMKGQKGRNENLPFIAERGPLPSQTQCNGEIVQWPERHQRKFEAVAGFPHGLRQLQASDLQSFQRRPTFCFVFKAFIFSPLDHLI